MTLASRRKGHVLLLAGIAALVAGSVAFAVQPGTANNKKRFVIEDLPPEPLDPAAVLFGEVMFDYYNERNFPAITNLMIARDAGFLTERDDYSEMLRGDLYTAFGLAGEAEKIFAGLVQRDILAKTRNETWFHTAELQYNQGAYDDAARILENSVSGLPPAMEKERIVMLGNIYILRGDFQRATELLASVKADDTLGAYALYNAGVAFIRAGEIERGVPLLRRARDLPPGDEETNALKDRSALAIGYTWLQKGDNELARESLLTIRMDGPYTNEAMLGLGYANFQRGDFKKALPLWLELLQRNTSDTTVQEALLLAPRAYEELGALPQALFGYRYAADTLRNELKKVERTIVRVRDVDWLLSLSPETAEGAMMVADPLAPVVGFTPAKTPEAPYLYSLFASKEFAENYKLFLELKRIERLLDHWDSQLPAYRAMLNEHRAKLTVLRPRIEETIARRGREVGTLWGRLPEIQTRIEAAVKNNDVEQTATVEQLRQLDMARALEARAGGDRRLAERVRRVKGLVLWDIAASAPAQQQQVQRDLAQARLDLEMARVRLEALEQVRRDVDYRLSTGFDRKISAATQRINQIRQDVLRRIETQTVALQNQALVVLADNRRNLGAQLAETHLAIARLQDSSVSEAIEKRKRQ